MASQLVDMVQHSFGANMGSSNRMDSKAADRVPDVRYPSYASKTEDARLVTDYRPQCTKNVRTGQQFFTKKWMIANADQIMEESRRRQVMGTGASLPMAQTVPPPAVVVHSTPFHSEAQLANPYGIGSVRADAAAPSLFGTFTYPPSFSEILGNRKNISLTVRAEGGRNARRGQF